MKIKELAQIVAEELNEMIKEAECENFKDMKRLYDWTAADIRSEIEYIIRYFENAKDSGRGQLDDGSVVNFKDMNDTDDECTYGTFKKMVFANVK